MITLLNTKEYATVQVCAILNTPSGVHLSMHTEKFREVSVCENHWLVLTLLGLREYKSKEVVSVIYYFSVQGGHFI